MNDTLTAEKAMARRNMRTAIFLALIAAGSLGLFVWQIVNR